MKGAKAFIVFFLFSLILVIAACSGPHVQPDAKADSSGATGQGIAKVTEGNNRFALALYNQLSPQSENIFFSPYSISTAMAIAYEGAKGETAFEMQELFLFPENATVRRSSYAALHNMLNNASGDYELSTANALWADKGFGFLPGYIDTARKYYGAEVSNLDFTGQPEESRQTINSWVAEHTNDKIKDLIPQWSINSQTRLVITNAIYFKGEWKTEFDKSDTEDSEFHKTDYESVPVRMMHLSGPKAVFGYFEDDSMQVLDMPYDGDDLSMLVFLPKKNDILPTEGNLTYQNLQRWRSLLSQKNVEVYFPKFTFDTRYFLTSDLGSMGMTTPLSMDADFSGMDGKKDLYMTNVIHQAYVAVDEQGTEAAAATGVMVGATSAAQKTVFRADHPFIFIIQDDRTGTILFIGRVEDPDA